MRLRTEFVLFGVLAGGWLNLSTPAAGGRTMLDNFQTHGSFLGGTAPYVEEDRPRGDRRETLSAMGWPTLIRLYVRLLVSAVHPLPKSVHRT
ncbi:hypothetical protein GGS24DRAFT_438056 [Hypoxylon argillaceum]|nr:hypothetical protein GGS24DRAFT_438056 [Hypoxylon argillaceum]KAI1156005.1 hypothetical protein F4825DRAFT_405612 [Nemania diffusa]